MDIKSSSTAGQQALLQAISGNAELSRVETPGRIFIAAVESIARSSQTGTSKTLFDVIINADGQRIRTITQQPFQIGQSLKIEVSKDASLRVLEILSAPTKTHPDLVTQGPRPTPGNSDADLISQNLRTATTKANTNLINQNLGTATAKANSDLINQNLSRATGKTVTDPIIQNRRPAQGKTNADLISQGLRQALPLQQNLSPRQPTVSPILNNLASLPAILGRLNSSGDNKALLQLQQQVSELLSKQPKLEQLRDPTTLKQAVLNSNGLLEAKLKAVAQQLTPPTVTHEKSKQSLRTNEQSIRTKLAQNPLLNKQAQRLVAGDAKAQLIKLVRDLAPLLSKPVAGNTSSTQAESQLIARIIQAAAPASTAQHTTTPLAPDKQMTTLQPIDLPELALNTQLKTLFRQTGIRIDNHQTAAPRESLDLAISTLLRQVAASIAKLQATQLSGLSSQQAGPDGPLLNSWHVEIPVLMQGQFRPIQLQIDEERSPEQSNDSKQIRQWKVTLGFDFEGLGEFYATLKIIGNNVSTTFWSEQPQTLRQIQRELDRLKSALKSIGLEVNQLECRKGTPPLKSTRLDQQLVDIKT